ncbi:alpha/beta hydrolase [Chitinivorax sp. B]|uniref:alpha/beta hydrolase n=1 Tax=Chitinivorax sp. B TaxID=2502235 RepID=UPI0020178984|nr:alpha/beta hydrolase [Chitinivorax sp. B]
MQEERLTLTASDGHPIFTVCWLPDQPPLRGIVHISHGMAEHCLRYHELAVYLNQHGIAVYTHDHRGHGHSVQGDETLGHFNDQDGWTKVLGDMLQVNRFVHSRHPDLPIVLLGHSMGSFITRAYLLQHANTLAGAIISSTGIRYGGIAKLARSIARWDAKRIGPRTPSKLMGKLSFGTFNLQFMPNRTAFDWLSRDPEKVDAYVADPFCGFDCSTQLWIDLFGGIVAMEQAEADGRAVPVGLPTLFIAGSRDPVSMGGRGCRTVMKRYQAAGMQDVNCRIYPGGRHEILNETGRETIYADLVVWLLQHFDQSHQPSPATNEAMAA